MHSSLLSYILWPPCIQSLYFCWIYLLIIHVVREIDTSFPADLPVPKDDGHYDHLTDFQIPTDISLPVASDPSQRVVLVHLPGLTVLFIYPRTGRPAHFIRLLIVKTLTIVGVYLGAPNEDIPDSWNAIPGARGCTPQACSFRDHFSQLRSLGVAAVYGISTQSPAYQAEVHRRLHLPYDLLSDEKLTFQQTLQLPTFDWNETKVLKRSMVAVQGGKIVKWWYPVFPPDRGVEDVVEWLKYR